LEDCPGFTGEQNDDPVLPEIKAAILHLAQEDIGVAAARIRVFALTNAPPPSPATRDDTMPPLQRVSD
jgi:hypothetical protein